MFYGRVKCFVQFPVELLTIQTNLLIRLIFAMNVSMIVNSSHSFINQLCVNATAFDLGFNIVFGGQFSGEIMCEFFLKERSWSAKFCNLFWEV